MRKIINHRSGPYAVARELAIGDESGDLTEHAADLGALVTDWQRIYDSLLDGTQVNAVGDVQSAREKIVAADQKIQQFRERSIDLTDIVDGLDLGLMVTKDGQKSSLGSLISDLLGDMSSVIILLDEATRQLQPSPVAERLRQIERTLRRVTLQAATPTVPRSYRRPPVERQAERPRVRYRLRRVAH